MRLRRTSPPTAGYDLGLRHPTGEMYLTWSPASPSAWAVPARVRPLGKWSLAFVGGAFSPLSSIPCSQPRLSRASVKVGAPFLPAVLRWHARHRGIGRRGAVHNPSDFRTPFVCRVDHAITKNARRSGFWRRRAHYAGRNVAAGVNSRRSAAPGPGATIAVRPRPSAAHCTRSRPTAPPHHADIVLDDSGIAVVPDILRQPVGSPFLLLRGPVLRATCGKKTGGEPFASHDGGRSPRLNHRPPPYRPSASCCFLWLPPNVFLASRTARAPSSGPIASPVFCSGHYPAIPAPADKSDARPGRTDIYEVIQSVGLGRDA